MKQLYKTLIATLSILIIFVFHKISYRSTSTQLSFESQRLESLHTIALQQNNLQHKKIQDLQDNQYLKTYAQTSLGMSNIHPQQLILLSYETV